MQAQPHALALHDLEWLARTMWLGSMVLMKAAVELTHALTMEPGVSLLVIS